MFVNNSNIGFYVENLLQYGRSNLDGIGSRMTKDDHEVVKNILETVKNDLESLIKSTVCSKLPDLTDVGSV